MFLTRKFRPLTFWTGRFAPWNFGPGRLTSWHFGPGRFAPWHFWPGRFALWHLDFSPRMFWAWTFRAKDVSPLDFLDLAISHPDVSDKVVSHPDIFGPGRFGLCLFWTRTFCPWYCYRLAGQDYSWTISTGRLMAGSWQTREHDAPFHNLFNKYSHVGRARLNEQTQCM